MKVVWENVLKIIPLISVFKYQTLWGGILVWNTSQLRSIYHGKSCMIYPIFHMNCFPLPRNSILIEMSSSKTIHSVILLKPPKLFSGNGFGIMSLPEQTYHQIGIQTKTFWILYSQNQHRESLNNLEVIWKSSRRHIFLYHSSWGLDIKMLS